MSVSMHACMCMHANPRYRLYPPPPPQCETHRGVVNTGRTLTQPSTPFPPQTNTQQPHSGVVNTGHIITAAGVIMAVAFSGLLFSSEVGGKQARFPCRSCDISDALLGVMHV